MNGSDLDKLDLLLLDAMQRNARSTYAELGTVVGLRPPAVHDRVKRLEKMGYVKGYAAQLDSKRLGYQLTAFVACFVGPEKGYDEFAQIVGSFPEVLEIHSVAGDETYLLKVVTRSTAHLDDFLTRLKRSSGISRTKTTIVLSTPFERGGIAVVDTHVQPAQAVAAAS
jgi:Lrp/AsnC family leucine-responsive transcriptional regulator